MDELTKDELNILIGLLNNTNIALKEAHILLAIKDKLAKMVEKKD